MRKLRKLQVRPAPERDNDAVSQNRRRWRNRDSLVVSTSGRFFSLSSVVQYMAEELCEAVEYGPNGRVLRIKCSSVRALTRKGITVVRITDEQFSAQYCTDVLRRGRRR